jgi:hypothetical protein
MMADSSRADHIVRESTGSNFFCFVLAGSFEVQDRLMHMHDGVEVSADKEIEFEAMSDNAILLIIDLFAY